MEIYYYHCPLAPAIWDCQHPNSKVLNWLNTCVNEINQDLWIGDSYWKCSRRKKSLIRVAFAINNTTKFLIFFWSIETKVSSAQKVLWTIMLTKFMEFKQKKKTFIKGSFSCIHASSDILKEGSGLLMSSMQFWYKRRNDQWSCNSKTCKSVVNVIFKIEKKEKKNHWEDSYCIGSNYLFLISITAWRKSYKAKSEKKQIHSGFTWRKKPINCVICETFCSLAQWLFGPKKHSFHYWSAPRGPRGVRKSHFFFHKGKCFPFALRLPPKDTNSRKPS